MDSQTIKRAVQERYAGFVASNRSCCGPRSSAGCGCDEPADLSLQMGYLPDHLAEVPEGANLGLGCGNPVALASLKPGETVLDLGSGAGFDAFLAAKRVGPEGRVIGVDLTPEMIARATELAKTHGYDNVEFRRGDIEDLPVKDASVDVILSNCVVNLTTDKAQTFREAFRVLRPGGRLMVSDMVLARALPPAIRADLDAYAACLSGALLKEDYLSAIRAAGFEAVAVVGERRLSLDAVSPDLMAVARQRYPDLDGKDLEALAGSVLSIQVEANKARQGERACGCAPSCCGG